MLDDQQLREALRVELNSQPAPTVKTELSDIMPRGLRRRRFRQIGSVAAAMAVVAGVGVVAMTFGGKPSLVNEPAQTTDIPLVVPKDVNWRRADLPTKAPEFTFNPLPGVAGPGQPGCSGPQSSDEVRPSWIFPEWNATTKLVTILREVAAPAQIGEPRLEESHTGVRYYFVDITDSGGAGSLMLSTGTFGIRPTAMADATAFNESNCEPPKRLVSSRGAVVQIYPIKPGGEGSAFYSLSLSVYRSDGRAYQLILQNYGTRDLGEPVGGMRPIVGPGRPTLPLTEYQLSRLGEALMD
ncbi:hypothetical protein LWC34_19405 [Kibdelosporangium philippinense]|uniref:Tat pathway signal protein n=1 Tax=Kibdelosporangium philippinense TaxID=211113 RepID=A0ABS8ZGL1_9PSEU|nr:hypothetical protein [Kibdelosporangium philippinense]MCE7004977.1 hypothetical protein [Kibdelosporangium philippinense]